MERNQSSITSFFSANDQFTIRPRPSTALAIIPRLEDAEENESSVPKSYHEVRMFTAIICNKCYYLEFPGCDMHGLYTEMLPDGQAKCPSCAARTDNVKPFRDGCRRCKRHTSIHKWACSIQDVRDALSYFPNTTQEIRHTVLQCERCCRIAFPSYKEKLTVRTPNCALTGENQKKLKVSNFQRNMSHVESCPRNGMPLQTKVVQLTSTELKFLLERMEPCPIVPPITGGPQYLPRKMVKPEDDNQLHQVYLNMLSLIVRNFKYDAKNVVAPLKQIAGLMSTAKPMSIFSDWSPPRRMPEHVAQPLRVCGASSFSDQNQAECVLENSSTYWRSAVDSVKEQIFTIEFESPTVAVSINIRWCPKYMPKKWALRLLNNGAKVAEEEIVNISKPAIKIPIASKLPITALELRFLEPAEDETCFGIEFIRVCKRVDGHLYMPASSTLTDLQTWLSDIALHGRSASRELSTSALQGLALSSGSLSTILQLVKVLLADDESAEPFGPEAKLSAQKFIASFTSWILEHSFQNGTNKENDTTGVKRQAGGSSTVDNDRAAAARNQFRRLQQMNVRGLQSAYDEFGRMSSLSVLSNTANANSAYLARGAAMNSHSGDGSGGSGMIQVLNQSAARCGPARKLNESHIEPTSADPFLKVLRNMGSDQMSQSVENGIQLAMVILACLSELSVWHMQNMQKYDHMAISASKQNDSFPLEEGYCIQVCLGMFNLCHDILHRVLDHRLLDDPESAKRTWAYYEKLKTNATMLSKATDSLGFTFSPELMALSVLQVATVNLRRLVLSRVDPREVGITPAKLCSDVLAPPKLSPLLLTLEKLITDSAKPSDEWFSLSLQAAAAVEVGMEALYPSIDTRTKLLTSRMGKGSTLELQVRWPAEEGDQEDPRFERLLLLLQLECTKFDIQHTLRGSFDLFVHLIVTIPIQMDMERFLRKHIAKCIQKAGFLSWQVVAGAQEISVMLQRHLHWNRVDNMSHDSGSAWIRVYPNSVASYKEVIYEVDSFVKANSVTPIDDLQCSSDSDDSNE